MRVVKLSPRALKDLDRLPDFLELANPRAAKAVRAALEEGVSSLAEFPERGHPSEMPGYRELRVRYGRYGYALRYRVREHEVLVTRIRHVREQR
jgi:addiction module RelE/StbE family toxin